MRNTLLHHIVTVSCVCLVITGSTTAQETPRWAHMDLGPTFTSTVGPDRGVRFRNVSKAMAIRVGESGDAGVLFDTDTVRTVAGWTGGFVRIDPGRNALLGNDRIEGEAQFATPHGPGWAKGGSFEDPRPKPFGPIPRDWAKWRGHYMHGGRVVLSYTVGGAGVLEMPWASNLGDTTVFERQFEVEGAESELRTIVCEGGNAETKVIGGVTIATLTRQDRVTTVAVIGAQPRIRLVAENERVQLMIVPGEDTAAFRLFIATVPDDKLDAFAAHVQNDRGRVNLKPYTKGGPLRWTKQITTQADLGKGDGPYVLDTLTPPFDNPYKSILHFGGFDFLGDGRAAICTMEGDVWIVSSTGSDPAIPAGEKLGELRWKRYATGMYHPLGLKIVDDAIYVLCRDQITRLHDINGDGEADFYENFNNDVQVGYNSHEFATCLETAPNGDFFFIKGTNGGQTEHDSSVLRVSKDGKTFERFATGFRWPNGFGMSPDGVITAADQQGDWVPSSRLDIVHRGGFYGFMSSHHRPTPPEGYDGPLCWIPHWVDNSCGGQTWIPNEKWGLPKGMMLHLSYGKCLLFLVLQEKIGDVEQGGVVPFPVGKFDSGAMRARFNPRDGQLYVCGLQGWQTSGARDGCFQRVRYTGGKVNLPVKLNVLETGLRITFTEPLDKESAQNSDNWAIEQWNYQWTKNYGSKEYSLAEPRRVGHDTVAVDVAHLSGDGMTVTLSLPDGVEPVMQMHIKYNVRAADGKPVRGDVFNTIHAMAKDAAE